MEDHNGRVNGDTPPSGQAAGATGTVQGFRRLRFETWLQTLFSVGDTPENREAIVNAIFQRVAESDTSLWEGEVIELLAYIYQYDDRLWLDVSDRIGVRFWDKQAKERLDRILRTTLFPTAVLPVPGASFSPPEYPHDKPIPLRRELPSAKPYPIDALGEILAPMAQVLIHVVQAPDAICGQAVLAAATLAVQGHANIVIDGRISALSEFFLCVAESGERKTTADRYALWPHRHRQHELVKEYRTAFLTYQNAFDSYRKAREEALRAKSREAKRMALESLGAGPAKSEAECTTSETHRWDALDGP